MKIDFNAKKTDTQWLNAYDEFWRKVTPVWFDWLQWILVLGVIGFLAEQTRSIIVWVIYIFSYVALFAYLQSIFFSIEFKGFTRAKSKRVKRIVSILLSGIILVVVWFLLSSLIFLLKGKV